MPKAPRDNDSTTPKKRTRKAASNPGNGVHPENGNGIKVAPAVVTSPEIPVEAAVPSNLEEKIRARAYEFYLERGGHGGSPEQDWLRAVDEIRSQHRTV